VSRLTPVSRRELIRRLRKLGFDGPYPGGKHAYMKRGMVTARIPNPHHGEEIDPSLLDTVLDEAGISREEWFSVA
jgi:predicted RNA binding protein YcfA (HicA-like mRNA interferase family)